MTQYGFHFDATRCTGCKTCALACKDAKDLTCDQAFRRVYEFETNAGWTADENNCWTCGASAYYVSSACNHCDNPACVEACPAGSMTKHDEDGLVYNDPETCIGCGACSQACPYGAPVIDVERSLSIKCDGCHERVAAGLMPTCVSACPMRALDFGPIDELREKYGETAAIAPLPDPSVTGPNVVITPCRDALEVGAEGSIVNENELALA